MSLHGPRPMIGNNESGPNNGSPVRPRRISSLRQGELSPGVQVRVALLQGEPGSRPRENSNRLHHCPQAKELKKELWATPQPEQGPLQQPPVRPRKTSTIKEVTPPLVVGLGLEYDRNPCLDDSELLSDQKKPGPAPGLNPVGCQLDYCFDQSIKSTTAESLFYHFQEQMLTGTQGTFQGSCSPNASGAYQVGRKVVF